MVQPQRILRYFFVVTAFFCFQDVLLILLFEHYEAQPRILRQSDELIEDTRFKNLYLNHVSPLNVMSIHHEKLWAGEGIEQIYVERKEKHSIEVAVAYCDSNLTWMHDGLFGQIPDDMSIRLTFLSKCGNEEYLQQHRFRQNNRIEKMKLIVLPNVGGCDYAYAYFINKLFSEFKVHETYKSALSSSVVLFIKDTPRTAENFHFGHHERYRSVKEMIRFARSGGFICGVKTKCNVSPFHVSSVINSFTIEYYVRISERNQSNNLDSKRKGFNYNAYKDLGDFHKRALNWSFPNEELVQVCYGGTFALPLTRIIELMQDVNARRVLNELETVLSRTSEGGSTAEEHFAERTWAGLLSQPLVPEHQGILYDISEGSGVIVDKVPSISGALISPGNKRNCG